MPYFPGLSPITLDKTNGLVGMGTSPSSARLLISSSGEQLRLVNSGAGEICTFTLASPSGNLSIIPTGSTIFLGGGTAGGILSITGKSGVSNTLLIDNATDGNPDIYLTSSGDRVLSINNTGAGRMDLIVKSRIAAGALTPTASIHAAASVSGAASLCLPHGAAPTSPVNGDMWTTTAGLFVRINGATVGPLS